MSIQIESLTIHEDAKEGVEDEESFPTYPYERLKTTSMDPVADIDVTRREVSTFHIYIYIYNNRNVLERMKHLSETGI